MATHPTPSQRGRSVDPLVAEQERAAADEAGRIGGMVRPVSADPAMEPLYQAGEGEGDGWELAEAELVENATHGDGHGDPERDAFTPERESDRATAEYGECDHVDSTERRDETRPDAG
jgi:hypothetical protein